MSATRNAEGSILLPAPMQLMIGVPAASACMTSASLPAISFVCENVPEGKRAEVLTEEFLVSIFGTSADVAAVTSEDILVVADLSGFSAAAGAYTVPARVLVETSGDVGVSGTYQVRVNIQELTQDEEEESQIDTGETP